jgi:predicted dehydrogenase
VNDVTEVSRPVRACLVGIGGYGRTFLRAFKALGEEGLTRLAAVVVRNPAKYAEPLAELAEAGVDSYTTLDGALDAGGFDYVCLCTSLNAHRPQTIACLDAGFPVLCEKSAAPTVQDVQAMADAQERTGLPLDIAYPQQNASSVTTLQRLLQDGLIGTLSHIVVRGAWLREERYYQRSPWAGRARVDGAWTLDGPVNNPLAHYINNGMYFASDEPGSVARPVRVRGELYRARPTIEGEDTACIEAVFENGVAEYAYVTLVAKDDSLRDLRIDIYGDGGEMTWFARANEPILHGRRADGTPIRIEHEGLPGTTHRAIANFARVLLGESDRLYSPIGESLKFSRLSNGAFDSSGTVHPIPAEFVERTEEPVDPNRFARESEGETTMVYNLRGIVPAMQRAGDERALFSDLGLPWAVGTEPMDVTDYDHFPQRFEPRELPWE